MKINKFTFSQTEKLSKHVSTIFFIVISIAFVFSGCASEIKVVKEVQLNSSVRRVFLSVGEKTRPVKLENECTFGAQLDVLRVESLLKENISHFLKQMNIPLSDSLENADLRIEVRITDYEPVCWQGWMMDKENKRQTSMSYAGLRSFIAEVKYLDNFGIERGKVQVETKRAENLKDAAKEVSEKIADYTKKISILKK